ncbi:hypothetical protein IGI80_002289 [Enterococcus sp. DIV1420a]
MVRIIEVFGIETGKIYFKGPEEVVFRLLQERYPSCKVMRPVIPIYPETLRVIEVRK